jgi:hypothetical protein
MPVSFYCVWCGKKHSVPADTIGVRRTVNGQPQLVGECQKSGNNVYKFIAESKYAAAKKHYGYYD